MMKTTSLFGEIKKFARDLGFAEVGVTQPRLTLHYDTFQAWLSDGHAAGMTYLNTEYSRICRREPLRLFPECKSIIVLLARYPSPVVNGEIIRVRDQGHVAAYAWGQDYHRVLVQKLHQLAERINSIINQRIRYLAVTDNSPLLERELACSAGLGWIGKNSCLISPFHGSFTFIAELLMDLSIEATVQVIPDRCGTCNCCMEACPTRCILPNRTLHSEHCLSYLTIENRGHIPMELRPYLGDWIFGCDICQSVCPWNKRIGDSYIDRTFLLQGRVENLDLLRELTLSKMDFKRDYSTTPISRVGWGGYLRNVAFVLGNLQRSDATEILLQQSRNNPEAIVRAASVWALGKTGSKQEITRLKAALTCENDPLVREEIYRVLGNTDDKIRST